MDNAVPEAELQRKRALLANLLQQRNEAPALSVTQERIWQLDQIQPGTPIYNFQGAVELRGALDEALLGSALERVVARHEVLRTAYGAEKGQPKVTIASLVEPTLLTQDLSTLPAGEAREQALRRLARDEAQSRFELGRPPLFRLALVRLEPQWHLLILTMHHIVSDLLSLDIFMHELGEFYSAAKAARAPGLAPLSASYQDLCREQRSAAERGSDDPAVAYWRRTLVQPPVLEWLSDFPRPASASGAAGTIEFVLASSVRDRVEQFARQERVTPFMVLLAAFYTLVHGSSGQTDLVVGSPTGGRFREGYENLIGMFSYPLPLRVDLSGQPAFGELVQRVKTTVLGATEYAELPFATVVDAAQQSGPLRAPLVRAMFSYVSRLKDLQFDGLAASRFPTDRGMSDFDLFMTIYPKGDGPDDGWQAMLEYNAELFATSTVMQLASAYEALLSRALSDQGSSVSELAAMVPAPLPLTVAVAATFTADPLGEVIDFWSRELRVPVRLELAPYNQVFQQLLDPGSLLHTPGLAMGVLLVRPQDWARHATDASQRREGVEHGTREFIAAVREASRTVRSAIRLYLCPASPPDAELDTVVRAAEDAIREAVEPLAGVEVVDAEVATRPYPVQAVYDPRADRSGHVPYTPEYFTAFGTALFRGLGPLIRRPYKVIVLDCDNTLWAGVCAEVGGENVAVDEPYRALQSFMRQQAEAGMLLCLCSKNEPADVFEVFNRHRGMLLRQEDIVAHRINWETKSSNLRSLASELKLGLDSFIFVDDNPVECAEVSAQCPEVLTLCLPDEAQRIPHFLQHVWAFDRNAVSTEDRKRTESYRANRLREDLRESSASFSGFLDSLALEVDIAGAQTSELERVAQLSYRTNQFNASGVRYDEKALHRAMSGGIEVLTVHVRDRFGDYGLVGAVTYRARDDELHVESLFLSCRVLGRGVEHRIVAALGRVALERELGRVRIDFVATDRNVPVRNFLTELGGAFEEPATLGRRYSVGAATAARVAFNPGDADEASGAVDATQAPAPAAAAQAHSPVAAALQRIPAELASVEQIHARLSGGVRPGRGGGAPGAQAAPKDELERAIAGLWAEVLRFDAVGREDNFFDIGGNSLLLVQLNSRLIETLGVDIAITELFQYPTVATLAAHLANKLEPGVALQEVQDRGSRARSQLQQRKRRLGVTRNSSASRLNINGDVS